jgi:hypothetical protein
MPARRARPVFTARSIARSRRWARGACAIGSASRWRRKRPSRAGARPSRLWVANAAALDDFRQNLGEVRDLERTLGRLSAGSGNGRDLLALRVALEKIPPLKEILARLRAPRAPAELPVIKEEASRRA